MHISLSFAYDDGRIVEIDKVRKLEVEERPVGWVLVVNSSKRVYNLRLIADIRMIVHRE